jgi:methionyl-tRNA formyltransferase
MRVLFWGTPSFALPSFRALLGEGHDVVGVVTQPDRPSGRGRRVQSSPVKEEAAAEHIPVLQPDRPRGDEFLTQINELRPDISIVVAYGQILRSEVLEAPRLGSLNVHASLLPELRGAAPINWAIIRGYETTGVTIMRMVAELDAGPILHQVAEPIAEGETATDLFHRLSQIGAEALIATLALMEFGGIDEVEQDHSRATYAPRIEREDARVDWSQPARQVANRIRGLDEVPGGWTRFKDKELKVFRPLAEPDRAHDAEPGTVLDVVPHDPAFGLAVACGVGAVRIREVTPEGKRRMTSAEWVRGRGIEAGVRFGEG